MAIIRQVLEHAEAKKWAYVERSDEDKNVFAILGGKTFDTEAEAVEYSKGFMYGSYQWKDPKVVKIPSVGRTVMYYPLKQDDFLGLSHPSKMAAIVVDGGDLAPDISVFTRWQENPVVLKLSVLHKSAALGPDGYHSSYWDWPEIK